MAKKISISTDGGSTYHLLPGSTGDYSTEAGSIEDTVFGAGYQSQEAGVAMWSVSANAYYKGFAGYVCKIKKAASSPTSVSGEASSQVDSSQTWQIDDSTKQIWDRTASVTVNDGGSPVADANIESIDYLFGRVTFAQGYTPSGAITFDVSYFGLESLGSANSLDLTQSAEEVQDTDFDTAQSNNGYHTFFAGLKTVEISLSGIYKSADALKTAIENRDELIVEINPDGNSKSVCRGFFRLISQNQSGDVGGNETEELTGTLNVPTDADIPFGWTHAGDTTMPTALKELLTAWQAGDNVHVKYEPDDGGGREGSAVITDISMSTGLDAMNEFSLSFQGSGEPAEPS